MKVWQADFYRRPLQDDAGHALWELVVCGAAGEFHVEAFCSQPAANSAWLAAQLQAIADDRPLPDIIQVFRPQSLSLIEAACKPLGIAVEPTRRTPTLKHWLQQRAEQYRTMANYTGQPYAPVELEKPPPAPLPETLWGERWRFAAIDAGDLVPVFQHRPIPILEMPEALLPLRLNVPSTVAVPGVVIDGGRQSMQLARWLQQVRPVSLTYIPGEPDGLILEAGLVDRWIVATFDDREVAAAAQTFRERLSASQGLHFLLVQPDDTGVTYSGLWLLQSDRQIGH
ncbi:Tab2/Atab2 family RNA-binding protein [Oculatella sp. LEGE 06141]|uniref:Tab2/Atab2 family RNA-binding protein n=1 Tax=Oculatella sp. LEGE 06141 TaxID=1828648 RepID=UPI001882B489|nr:Tab2/Atab2 family RNA-binding protein [Oculatella sp. LEGE 06141]MBE9179814.1 Tab2/Atab2 family RNA-binding protein [Oculatella sp. LEGE 06141]